MSGYVRIHRTLIGHPAFRNDAEAMAFAWLVAKAAWQPTRVRYKERPISLGRGQLAVSVRDFASAMDRDKAWCERLLKRLKSETMIETRHETGVNVITICNYEEYQSRGLRGETVGETPNKTGARQGRDTEQGREKGEEGNTPKPPRGRKSEKCLLPDDWVLPTVAELPPQAKACAEQWSASSYATRGEEFVSYWRSRGRMMKDWRLTWAGRVVDLHSQVMRDQKFGNAPPESAKRLSPAEQIVNLEKWIPQWERTGRHADVEQARRKIAELRQHGPPERRTVAIGDIANKVANRAA